MSCGLQHCNEGVGPNSDSSSNVGPELEWSGGMLSV